MTAAEEVFTPSVERAAELLIHEAETTGLIRDDVRNGLAVALSDPADPDDLARVLFVLDKRARGWNTSPEMFSNGWSSDRKHWRAVADSLRSHILDGAS